MMLSSTAQVYIAVGSTDMRKSINGLEPYWYMRFLLEKLTDLKTKEDFLPFIPQNIDKQLVLDLRAKHMNLNSTN